MLQTLKDWDRDLFVYLNGLGIERFDNFWIGATQVNTWIPLFVVFFILIFYFYKAKNGFIVVLFLLITLGATVLFTDFVKEHIARLRPNNVESLSKLIRILQKPTNFSFFSGHASTSFAVTTFVVLSLRRFTTWIFLAYLWPLIFVLSRIFVGVHYPSDIMVGALVGTLIAFFFHFLDKKVRDKYGDI